MPGSKTTVDEVLADVGFRARAIMEGELILSKTFSTPINESVLAGTNGLLYITAEAGGKEYYHLLANEGRIIGCINELKGLSGEACLEGLSRLLKSEGIRVKINTYKIRLELVGDKAEALATATSSRTRPLEAEREEKREAETVSIETVPLAERSERTVSIGLIEYKLANELDKLGYMVDSVKITTLRRDVLVTVRLLRSAKPPSLMELASISAKYICTDYTVPDKLGVEVIHKKRRLIELSIGGDKRRCLLYGLAAETLRKHALVITSLEVRGEGGRVVVIAGAKRLPGELAYNPVEAAKELKASASSLLGAQAHIILKTGIIGGKIEV